MIAGPVSSASRDSSWFHSRTRYPFDPQEWAVTNRRLAAGWLGDPIISPPMAPCQDCPVRAQPEPVESISAVTLLTTSMVDAVAFYEALSFHLLYGGPDAPFTSFRVGGGYLNLQLDADSRPLRGGWGRVVLWVDDVDAMHGRALTAGFKPESSPADAPWGERYFHIRDPDGHELSFARPLAERERPSAPRGES